jgi:CheY-like chemotaxis protein
MEKLPTQFDDELMTAAFGASLKGFHELMPHRIQRILLVSSPYEAFIMEEDRPMLESIDVVHQGRPLGLTMPAISRVATAGEALELLSSERFDIVITMPRLIDMNAFKLAETVKMSYPRLPVFLLTQNTHDVLRFQEQGSRRGVDRVFVWSGNPDLLFAMIRFWEDRKNVNHDIRKAMIRVILFVEDSPVYKSSLLPILYKNIFQQSSEVFEEGLDERRRLLKLRARPKILVAENYEDALKLYKRYAKYLMAIISDTKFPRGSTVDPEAGIRLLRKIRKENPDLPLLLLSSNPQNYRKAGGIPAFFLGKYSASLSTEIAGFFRHHLGFGDFVFQMPDGSEVARAHNLRTLEKVLPRVPDESLIYHAHHNYFSNWLMARTEVFLASLFRAYKVENFGSVDEIRGFILRHIRRLRQSRFQGSVVNFKSRSFDEAVPFCKMGKGSMGGKARGLAFMSRLLSGDSILSKPFPQIQIGLPQTIVIATGWYDVFLEENGLENYFQNPGSNDEVIGRFLVAELPHALVSNLRSVLSHLKTPLAVRSSSLLEDSQFKAFAGLYSTIMLPNAHPRLVDRLKQLETAVKLVYASMFFEEVRNLVRGTLHRIEEDKMAVILQRLVGRQYGNFFYPWISGVAQSKNYYPVGSMRTDEGIVHIALGLGKTVVDEGGFLSFSPRFPRAIPNFTSVDEILKHSQREFYALRMDSDFSGGFLSDSSTLQKREISRATSEAPVSYLTSAYVPEDHCIRDAADSGGSRVLTFANVLKYQSFPLGEIVETFLDYGRREFGTSVEIEFSVNLKENDDQQDVFQLLQIRPMSIQNEFQDVEISSEEMESAFCCSQKALGNGVDQKIKDIIYVRPDRFNASQTLTMAAEIKQMNAVLQKKNRNYVLIGPGRWGSSDHWLGIPITWSAISSASAIIETAFEGFQPDPSLGSHLFHNLVTAGISYLTVRDCPGDRLDWEWLAGLPASKETRFIRHIALKRPLTLKVDGRRNLGVILA